jgi:3-oxoacyl-[acyl-carrier protein] reductase
VEPHPLGQPPHDQGDVRAAGRLPLPVPGAGREELSGAVVTGASRDAGIAAAVALALARDGWDVLTTGLPAHDEREGWSSEPEEIVARLRGLGVRAAWHEDDLADPAAPGRILDAAERAVGPVSALVACHAHSETGGLLATDAAQLDRHLAVNVRGTLLLAQELVRRLDGPGRIVVFTSRPPLAGEVAYAASKGALEWFVLSAAVELGPHGITVNAVDPGPTDTGWMTDELRDAVARATPLGGAGAPGDTAALVAFLCSHAAARVTGQVVHADGGFSLLGAAPRFGREPV